MSSDDSSSELSRLEYELERRRLELCGSNFQRDSGRKIRALNDTYKLCLQASANEEPLQKRLQVQPSCGDVATPTTTTSSTSSASPTPAAPTTTCRSVAPGCDSIHGI